MSDYRTIKFVYSNLMAFDPLHGIFPVEGEEYEVKYEETPELTTPLSTGVYTRELTTPLSTGVYRINGEGKLIRPVRIEITGNSYGKINRETGEITRVDSGYGTSISRYDENGRDLVEIIKKSIVAWTKIS
jgi:hypothetical protein